MKTGVYSKARLFGTALPSSNSNLLSADIIPTFDNTEFRIHVAASKAGVLSMKRTDILTGTVVSEKLSTTNMGADEGWTFHVPVRVVTRYNFTFSATGGTIFLQVDEVEQ